MGTINVKATDVRVYFDGSNIKYRLGLDTAIDAIIKRDGKFVEATADYIDFNPSVLIAQCLALVEGLDILYIKKKEYGLRKDGVSGFGSAELQLVLRNAKLTLERTKFEAGDEYVTSDEETATHEHAGYSTKITKIEVSERIQKKLDDIIDKMFDI